MLKIIITGATGMIGKGVLLECLDHPDISEVLVIGRNPVGIQHARLKEWIHPDFNDFSILKNKLNGYDACFYCLGISSAGMKENEYNNITYSYTLSLAKTLIEINPGMTFNYVSGEGTDSSEKGRMMWARIKGKTENELTRLGFKQAFMFRPGLIIPKRGIRSRTRSYRFFYDYFMWLIKIIKTIAPKAVVDTSQIGLAMINSVLKGYSAIVLKPADIISLANRI